MSNQMNIKQCTNFPTVTGFFVYIDRPPRKLLHEQIYEMIFSICKKQDRRNALCLTRFCDAANRKNSRKDAMHEVFEEAPNTPRKYIGFVRFAWMYRAFRPLFSYNRHSCVCDVPCLLCFRSKLSHVRQPRCFDAES